MLLFQQLDGSSKHTLYMCHLAVCFINMLIAYILKSSNKEECRCDISTFMCPAHHSSPPGVLISSECAKILQAKSESVQRWRLASRLCKKFGNDERKSFRWEIQKRRQVVIKNILDSRRAFVQQDKRLPGIKEKEITSSCHGKLLYFKWKRGKSE